MFKKIKYKLFSWLGLRDYPVVKVYNSYGSSEKLFVMGHVFSLSPRPRKTYTSNWFRNLFSVIRLFMVRTVKDAALLIQWQNQIFETKTQTDGFFILEIPAEPGLRPGWHPVTVSYKHSSPEVIEGHGTVFIPAETQVAYISDIDDTFLVSHTSKMRRRLYELFTHNARSRKTFEGVTNHYHLLANNESEPGAAVNPFFYVSSSEWNLYDFLMEFIHFNKLPRGVLLLGQIKKIKDFWKSGQNNHATKFMRIARILEAYPRQQFVLLGDDSQQDPVIYASIVEHFPDKILAVYLRRINKKNFDKVTEIVASIQAKSVACCYFEHSAAAVIHSKKTGLILE